MIETRGSFEATVAIWNGDLKSFEDCREAWKKGPQPWGEISHAAYLAAQAAPGTACLLKPRSQIRVYPKRLLMVETMSICRRHPHVPRQAHLRLVGRLSR